MPYAVVDEPVGRLRKAVLKTSAQKRTNYWWWTISPIRTLRREIGWASRRRRYVGDVSEGKKEVR
jgi:hypothetical protein